MIAAVWLLVFGATNTSIATIANGTTPKLDLAEFGARVVDQIADNQFTDRTDNARDQKHQRNHIRHDVRVKALALKCKVGKEGGGVIGHPACHQGDAEQSDAESPNFGLFHVFFHTKPLFSEPCSE